MTTMAQSGKSPRTPSSLPTHTDKPDFLEASKSGQDWFAASLNDYQSLPARNIINLYQQEQIRPQRGSPHPMEIASEHMASPTKLYEIVLNEWRKVSTSYFDGRDSSHDVNGQKVSSDGKMKRRKTMNMEEEASSSSWTWVARPQLSNTSSTKSSPQPGMNRGSLDNQD